MGKIPRVFRAGPFKAEVLLNYKPRRVVITMNEDKHNTRVMQVDENELADLALTLTMVKAVLEDESREPEIIARAIKAIRDGRVRDGRVGPL
jgi:hypothetical protein